MNQIITSFCFCCFCGGRIRESEAFDLVSVFPDLYVQYRAFGKEACVSCVETVLLTNKAMFVDSLLTTLSTTAPTCSPRWDAFKIERAPADEFVSQLDALMYCARNAKDSFAVTRRNILRSAIRRGRKTQLSVKQRRAIYIMVGMLGLNKPQPSSYNITVDEPEPTNNVFQIE